MLNTTTVPHTTKGKSRWNSENQGSQGQEVRVGQLERGVVRVVGGGRRKGEGVDGGGV